MGLIPSFDDGGLGISKRSLGNIIKSRLESTWDVSKTYSDIRYDGTRKDIYFDSTNQDFPASKARNRPIVVRIQSSRTTHEDLEIGLFTIRYKSRPVIHVYAYDVGATTEGEVSDLLEDMAQYIRRWVAEDPYRLIPDGVHCITGLEDDYISIGSSADPNWHHWYMRLDVEYEMRRAIDTDLPEFIESEFMEGEFV